MYEKPEEYLNVNEKQAATTFNDDDRLVSEKVSEEEHNKQEDEVRVSPYWIHLMVDLDKRMK